MGMDQYLLIPFLGNEHPFTSYFDVHQGYKVLTHCHMGNCDLRMGNGHVIYLRTLKNHGMSHSKARLESINTKHKRATNTKMLRYQTTRNTFIKFQPQTQNLPKNRVWPGPEIPTKRRSRSPHRVLKWRHPWGKSWATCLLWQTNTK